MVSTVAGEEGREADTIEIQEIPGAMATVKPRGLQCDHQRGLLFNDSRQPFYLDYNMQTLRRLDLDSGQVTTKLLPEWVLLDRPGAEFHLKNYFSQVKTDERVVNAEGIYFNTVESIRRYDRATGMAERLVGNALSNQRQDGVPARDLFILDVNDLDVNDFDVNDAGTETYWLDVHEDGEEDRISQRIRKAIHGGEVSTLAGVASEVEGIVPLVDFEFGNLTRLHMSPDGQLYVFDAQNFQVFKVDSDTGNVSEFLGNGIEGETQDGALPLETSVEEVVDMCVSEGGLPFFLTRNHLLHVPMDDDGNPENVEVLFSSEDALMSPNRFQDIVCNGDTTAYVTYDFGFIAVRYDPFQVLVELSSFNTEAFFEGADMVPNTPLHFSPSFGDLTQANQTLVGLSTTFQSQFLNGYFDAGPRIAWSPIGRRRPNHTLVGKVDPTGLGVALEDEQGPWLPGEPVSMTPFRDGQYLVTASAAGKVYEVDVAQNVVKSVVGRPYSNERWRGMESLEAFPARFSRLLVDPTAIVFDEAGDRFFIAEPRFGRIHEVSLNGSEDVDDWTILDFVGQAGFGEANPPYADGPVGEATIGYLHGLALDVENQKLYFADSSHHVIRVVDLNVLEVSLVAGQPDNNGRDEDGNIDDPTFGEGGPAQEATFFYPTWISLAPNGDLYVADEGNRMIRRITTGEDTPDVEVFRAVGSGLDEAFEVRDGDLAGNVNLTNLGAHDTVAVGPDGSVFLGLSETILKVDAGDNGIVEPEDVVSIVYQNEPRALNLTMETQGHMCFTGLRAVDESTLHALASCQGMLVEFRLDPE